MVELSSPQCGQPAQLLDKKIAMCYHKAMSVIYLRVSNELKKKLNEIAKSRQISTVDLVRQILFEWLETEEIRKKMKGVGLIGLPPFLK